MNVKPLKHQDPVDFSDQSRDKQLAAQNDGSVAPAFYRSKCPYACYYAYCLYG